MRASPTSSAPGSSNLVLGPCRTIQQIDLLAKRVMPSFA